uniref:Uncharacterized protein n=1 Tax=Arundo donax TaxID=35708 RepID=A0A0A9MVJ0_ARUDO
MPPPNWTFHSWTPAASLRCQIIPPYSASMHRSSLKWSSPWIRSTRVLIVSQIGWTSRWISRPRTMHILMLLNMGSIAHLLSWMLRCRDT